jgi:hypothetical protein
VVINDLNLGGTVGCPHKANAPLIVDANAVLTLSVSAERPERVNEIATPSVMNFRKLMLGFVQMW